MFIIALKNAVEMLLGTAQSMMRLLGFAMVGRKVLLMARLNHTHAGYSLKHKGLSFSFRAPDSAKRKKHN